MSGKQDDSVVISNADWLAELSGQARKSGDYERADRLLLLAWMAYDGQTVTLRDFESTSRAKPGESVPANHDPQVASP